MFFVIFLNKLFTGKNCINSCVLDVVKTWTGQICSKTYLHDGSKMHERTVLHKNNFAQWIISIKLIKKEKYLKKSYLPMLRVRGNSDSKTKLIIL